MSDVLSQIESIGITNVNFYFEPYSVFPLTWKLRELRSGKSQGI